MSSLLLECAKPLSGLPDMFEDMYSAGKAGGGGGGKPRLQTGG